MYGIKCKEQELTESPKILDYGDVSKMRHYMDLNGNYYYLEDPGRQIYDDKIVEQVKETADTVGPFATGLGAASSTSYDVKTLMMVCFRNFLQIIKLGKIGS